MDCLTYNTLNSPTPFHAPKMKASVVIATYNRGSVLFDTIEMVMNNTHPDYELLVVDQTPSPEDDYRQKIQALVDRHGFQYLTLPAPSLTFARNVGIVESTGEIIIFIDDDVELGPDFVEAHVGAYENPDVGAVAGRVTEPHGNQREGEGRIGFLRNDGSFEGNFYKEKRTYVDFGRGCNMSFRKSHLTAIGGCDERYGGGFYREDGDLFARVKHRGCKVLFEPEAHVVHLEAGGGSRTDRGKKDLKRQYSVFRNETLFFLNCIDGPSLGSFLYRMLGWIYAVKQTRGYNWAEFLYLLRAVWDGWTSSRFVDPHHLSREFGFSPPGLFQKIRS